MVANRFKALPPPSAVRYGEMMMKRWNEEPRELPLPQVFRDTVIRMLQDAGLIHSSKSFGHAALSEALYQDIGLLAFQKDMPTTTYQGNSRLEWIEIRLIESGWCPSERSLLFGVYNATSQYHAAHLGRPGPDKDHVKSSCSE